jgi:hypothetical protein
MAPLVISGGSSRCLGAATAIWVLKTSSSRSASQCSTLNIQVAKTSSGCYRTCVTCLMYKTPG